MIPTYWVNRNGRTHVHVPGLARTTFTSEYGKPVQYDSTYRPEYPDTLCGKSISPKTSYGMTEVDSLVAGVPCKICAKKLAKLQEAAPT